ncbi:MAG: type IX secretion system membrane protein PorP/SprF [Bacteroidota bacterium]
MKKIILILIGIVSLNANAQQDAQSSFYFYNPMNYNPAYAGSRGSLNFTGVHRSQWVGWDGAPTTQFLSVHAPVARKHIGIGGNLSYDRIGSRTNFTAMANFAYHMQLNSKDLRLSLGASAGLNSNQHDFNNLSVSDQTDPIFISVYSATKPNFGLGAYLYSNRFYFGFSVPHLLKSSLGADTSNSFLQRHFYSAAGYAIPISTVFDLKPSLLVKYTANAPMTIDFNLSAYFFKRFWVGGLYRMNEAIGINTSYQINNKLMVGYAFDFPFNKLSYKNWGSHEIVICIDLRSKNNAFISPRYF